MDEGFTRAGFILSVIGKTIERELADCYGL